MVEKEYHLWKSSDGRIHIWWWMKRIENDITPHSARFLASMLNVPKEKIEKEIRLLMDSTS